MREKQASRVFSNHLFKRLWVSFLPAAAVFILTAAASAQSNLVSSKFNGVIAAAEINQRIKTVFRNPDLPQAANAVDLYKVSYRSRNDKNAPVVLTGLVALPKTEAPKGLVIFNHGTTTDRNMSPSRYTGGKATTETELAILAFASGGYAVAMPDYLGLGDEKGFHPYPLGAINQLSAVDIIAPARALARRQNVALGSRLFVTGYSEGGAVAMWAARELEIKIRRGLPVDGFGAAVRTVRSVGNDAQMAARADGNARRFYHPAVPDFLYGAVFS